MGQKRPKKVLIAEDEALIRLDLVELLTEEGFEVGRQRMAKRPSSLLGSWNPT